MKDFFDSSPHYWGACGIFFRGRLLVHGRTFPEMLSYGLRVVVRAHISTVFYRIMEETTDTRKNTFLSFWQRMCSKPERALLVFLVAWVLCYTLFSTFLRSVLPGDTVESVSWGAKLQWGSYKHPPLAAWIAYAAARLTGYGDWVFYFLVHFCVALGVWYVYRTARIFLDGIRSVVAALLLFSCHYYVAPVTSFTPNSVQMALQPMMAFYFLVALRRDRWRDWLLLAAVCAAGFLSKYPVFFLVVAMIAAICLVPQWRRYLRSVHAWGAAFLFFALVSPHLKWLFDCDFAPMLYVNSSVCDEESMAPWLWALYVIPVAFYPVLTGACVLAVASLPRNFWRAGARDASVLARYSAILHFLPCLLLMFLALAGHTLLATWFSIMASWAGIFVVGVWPWKIGDIQWRRIYAMMWIMLAVVVLASIVHLATPSKVNRHLDCGDLCRQVSEAWQDIAPAGERMDYLLGDQWMVNLVEFYSPSHPVSVDADDVVMLPWLSGIARERGILLAAYRLGELADIKARLRVDEDMLSSPPHEIKIHFKSLWGDEKNVTCYLLYLPPGSWEYSRG